MTTYRGSQQLQHLNNIDIWLSLYWGDKANTDYRLIIRRVSDDAETNVYINYNVGFIDDDSVTSDGVTTVSDWIGASTAYVAEWRDISGKNNHVVQNTAGNQPQLILNGSGNLVSIYFLNQNLEVLYTEFNSIPTSTFLVLNINDITGFNNYLFSHTINSVPNNKRELSIPPSGEELVSTGNDDSATIFRGFYGSPVGYNANQLYYLGSNGIDNTAGRKNGVAVFNETTTNVGGYNNRHDRYRIGGGFVGTNNNVVINELLSIKRDISTDELSMIERELMTEHGIS